MTQLFKPTLELSVSLQNEYAFGGLQSLGQAIGYLVTPAFVLAALALVFYFVIGSFKYILSRGDKGALEEARNMIIHAIIGFILLLFLFLVLQFLPDAIGLQGFKVIR